MVRLLTSISIIFLYFLLSCQVVQSTFNKKGKPREEEYDDGSIGYPIDLDEVSLESSDSYSSTSQDVKPGSSNIEWVWNRLCSCYTYLRHQFNCYMWGKDCPQKRRRRLHKIVGSNQLVNQKLDPPPTPPPNTEGEGEDTKEEMLTPDKNLPFVKRKALIGKMH